MEADMEHRLSARAPLKKNVAIYYNSIGVLQGQAVDVSRHGMFIRTGRLALPLHALDEVVFPLEQQSDAESVRAPAMEVRVAPNGNGEMFGNEEDVAVEVDGSNGADAEEFHQRYSLCASRRLARVREATAPNRGSGD